MGRVGDSVKKLRSGSKRTQKTAKGGKPGSQVIPIMERERVTQMYLLGKKKREIARETHHTQKSIARIIKEADIEKYVVETRGRFVGLGQLAVETLEMEMRRGNWELAYKFLKDSGILADVQGRALAAQVAGVSPTTTHVALDAEARDMILNSLSDADRQVFRVLQMFREKSIAYGLGDNIDLPEGATPGTPSETPGTPDAKGA